jgi:tRNA/tmRNA/rRNA uracil-C5-methylase (TrmA/RlmC/RlmD family)
VVAHQAGDHLTLRVEDIAFGGEGVARADDFVVFIPFVALGELVETELTEVKKKFARGRLIQVIERSPDRVQPLCPYFGMCGGCQYQHLDYPVQLRIKHRQISDIFQRIGGFSPGIVAPVVPCPTPYGYRNRIMIRSQWDKFKQGLNIGFIRCDSRLVIDIEECKIAEPAISAQIKDVRANPPPKGGLKVVLRMPPPDYEVPRDSFFQNNFYLLPKLVEAAAKALESAGTTHLVDVYCGVGFFSLELAHLVESYAGVELDRLAIKSAKNNAISKGRTNGDFIAADAERALPGLLAGFHPEHTTVLLDPPRTGIRPQMLAILREVRPAQLIYVSCHPATMARDLNVLTVNGVFDLKTITPLDMFPQTSHLESVADLRSSTSK